MKNIIFVLLLLTTTSLYSQKIGLKAGFGYTKLSKIDGGVQPIAGIFIQTPGKVYFTAEVNYKGIGGSLNVVTYDSKNRKISEKRKSFSFKYIDIPLMVGVKGETSKITPFLNAGAYIAKLIQAKYDNQNIQGIEQVNFGLVISPGLMMSEKVSIEARLYKGINAIDNHINTNTASYIAIYFLLGYRF